jgi:hypothetical protein
MDHFAGLDVSVKDTSVCIVDDTGKIVREVKPLGPATPRSPWRGLSVLDAVYIALAAAPHHTR